MVFLEDDFDDLSSSEDVFLVRVIDVDVDGVGVVFLTKEGSVLCGFSSVLLASSCCSTDSITGLLSVFKKQKE